MFSVTCMTYWMNKVIATNTIIKIDKYSDCISRKIIALYDYCFYLYVFNRYNILLYYFFFISNMFLWFNNVIDLRIMMCRIIISCSL
jgi:hypothetical protein